MYIYIFFFQESRVGIRKTGALLKLAEQFIFPIPDVFETTYTEITGS